MDWAWDGGVFLSRAGTVSNNVSDTYVSLALCFKVWTGGLSLSWAGLSGLLLLGETGGNWKRLFPLSPPTAYFKADLLKCVKIMLLTVCLVSLFCAIWRGVTDSLWRGFRGRFVGEVVAGWHVGARLMNL